MRQASITAFASDQADKPVFVQALVAKLAVEAFDVRVLDRLARSNEAQRDAARVGPRVERAAGKLRPVVDDDRLRQADRGVQAIEHARRREGPGSERSTSMATHSRVKSSTMFSVRKSRPSASVSAVKSIDQRSSR